MVFPVLVMTGLADAGKALLSETYLAASTSAYLRGQEQVADYVGLREDGTLNAAAASSVPADLAIVSSDGAAPGHYYSTQAVWLLEQLAALYPQAVFLVCYQAPWSAFDHMAIPGAHAEPVALLSAWLRCHQQLLQLRWRLQDRLLLLNVDHMDDSVPQLAAHLKQVHAIDTETMLKSALAARPTATQRTVWLSRAKALEAIAPEYWDVYEALESCALLFGREPEFRHQMSAAHEEALSAMAAEWDNALQAPMLKGRLAESEQRQQLFDTQWNDYLAASQQTVLELEMQTARNMGLEQQVRTLRLQVDKVLQDLTQLGSRLRDGAALPRIDYQLDSEVEDGQVFDELAAAVRKLALELRDIGTTADYLITQKSALQETLRETEENNAALQQLVQGLQASSIRARRLMAGVLAQQQVQAGR